MGASSTVTIKVNGSTDFTSGTVNTGTTNFSLPIIGKRTNRNGNTVDQYYDDAIMDDAAEPSDQRVRASVPIANGSTMQYTAGTGASDYTQVSELPSSAAEYVKSSGAASQVALFTTQSMSTLGISGATPKALIAMNYAQEDVSTTSSNRVRVYSSGSSIDSGNRNIGATSTFSVLVATNNPNGGGAWTEAAVDGTEVGTIENNAVAIRLNTTYKMIIYEPAAPAGGTTPMRMLMGMGV